MRFLLLLLLIFSSKEVLAVSVDIYLEEDAQAVEGLMLSVDVSGLPPVYGFSLVLSYDERVLEPVDGEDISPVELFISDRAIDLVNEINLEEGMVSWARSMMWPDDSVSGDGAILRLPVRALTEGRASLNVEEMVFATGAGEKIIPKIKIHERADAGFGSIKYIIAAAAFFLVLFGGVVLNKSLGKGRQA